MKLDELDESDDDEGGDSAGVAVRSTARSLDDPIPAMREVRARMLSMTKKEKGEKPGDDDTVVVLEDPEGLASQPAALSMWAYALAMLFDGNRSARAAVKAFQERYGQSLPPEQALELQRELDRSMFLHSRTFEKKVRKQITRYIESPVRKPSHAGTAYPEEPVALEKTIAGFFSGPDGPGPLDEVAPRGAAASDTIRGMIIPHIDLRVGGATYAHAYAELLNKSQAELFVILGVGHQALSDSYHHVSLKHFATPLGDVTTNVEAARRLAETTENDPELAELTHRTEFSVEFQALLLQSLMVKRAGRNVQILPVLCGSIDSLLTQDQKPQDDFRFVNFAKALRKELDASGKKWCVVCSVDFSHCGPEFGHNSSIDHRLLPAIKRGDDRLLKALARLDSNAFYAEITRTQNSRHVDGVMAIMTMFAACGDVFKSARVLHYDQMTKKSTHSAVSYVSMAFE